MLESVKVGYAVYRVRQTKLDGGTDGECDHDLHEIRLDESLKGENVNSTLIHEIFHAIWNIFGLPPRPGEERAVTVLSNGWLTVLRDNPKLMELLR